MNGEMMTYDYECDNCQKIFEIQCPMEERNIPKPCPKCRAVAARTMFASSPQLALVQKDEFSAWVNKGIEDMGRTYQSLPKGRPDNPLVPDNKGIKR